MGFRINDSFSRCHDATTVDPVYGELHGVSKGQDDVLFLEVGCQLLEASWHCHVVGVVGVIVYSGVAVEDDVP